MATTNKMTQKDFFTAVLALAELPEELATYANEQLDKLAAKNASASSKRKEKAEEENAPLMAKIREVLAEHPEGLLTSELAESIEASTSKASGLARKMVESGELTAEEVKIPKVGKRMRYTLAG